MKTKSSLNREMQLAFGSAILTLLVVAAISCRGMVVCSDSDRRVTHTKGGLENGRDLVFAMERIEPSSSRFLLLGTKSYLESYCANPLRIEQNRATICNLMVDDPERLAIEGPTAEKIRRVEIVISPGRVEGLAAATLIFGTALGWLIAGAIDRSAQRDSSAPGRAEEALRDTEEKYRMLLDGVQDYAIFMLDRRGQVVSWNVGAERIKGYTAEQILGRNFSCFFSPEDIKRGRPEEVLRLTAASGRHEEHGMRVRKDGSQFLAS